MVPVARLDRRTTLLYGIGDVANGVRLVLFGLFTLFLYTTVMGLPGSWVGLASMIALLWNAAIDPYVGYLSDKATSTFGRRHVFMLVGALTMGVSFWAFFSPPRNLPRATLLVWLLLTSLAVRTTTTVYGVPYYALGAELSADYHERTSITAIRSLLSLLGTMAAAGLSLLVFFPDRADGVDPKLNYAGYPAMGLVFGLTMSVAGLIATFGTLSRRPYLARRDAVQTPRQFLDGVTQCLRNPSFRVLFISSSLFFLGVVINGSLSLYYLTYYAGITGSTAVTGCQLAFFVGALVGVPCWLRVSRVVGKRPLFLFAAAGTAALMWAALLLVGAGHLFGTRNVGPLIVGHGLAGFFGSVLWFLPGSMIADVVDEDELTTGKRREGSFFGLFFLGQQVSASLSAVVTGALLEWFTGLIAGQAEQSAPTTYRIAVLYAALPAILVMAAAAVMSGYRLTHPRVLSVQAELERRRTARSAERHGGSPEGVRPAARLG